MTGEELLHSVQIIWKIWVIEYQFRGLPHAHIVFHAETPDGSQPSSPDAIDRVVQARYPTPDDNGKPKPVDTKYIARITKHMIHHHTEKCRRPGQLRCSKGFPFPINPRTYLDKRGFVVYQRLTEDDGWVVPHNRKILEEIDCHYNVLVASTRKVVRYLYKYLHKGPDTAASAVTSATPAAQKAAKRADTVNDQIKEYQYERNLTACEAVHRLCGFQCYMITCQQYDLCTLTVKRDRTSSFWTRAILRVSNKLSKALHQTSRCTFSDLLIHHFTHSSSPIILKTLQAPCLMMQKTTIHFSWCNIQ